MINNNHRESSLEKPKTSKLFERYSNIQLLIIGFILIIFIGSVLLSLPISSKFREGQAYIDALFTATSAVSTTGLIVEDTGSYYSLFGQIIILILIQIGGLGYMVFIVMIFYLFTKNISFRNNLLLQESVSGVNFENIIKITNTIILYTFIIETIGSFLFYLSWRDEFTFMQAIYQGVFHSISAFCTAGFSLFSNSFMNYQHDLLINLYSFIISIAGGIGFIVIYDLIHKLITEPSLLRFSRISSHSRLVIVMTVILISIGSFVIFISECIHSNPDIDNSILSSIFQAVSASSTTGFNSVDVGLYNRTTLLIIILLMFIGTAPASTGGGIKSTTFGIIWLAMLSTLKGKKDTNVFRKKIPPSIIKTAYGIALFSIFIILLDLIMLLLIEDKTLIELLFEVVSAFGTVGLSTGITAELKTFSKIILIFTMFIGRLGPLAIGSTLLGKSEPVHYTYSEGEFYLG